MDVKVNKYCLFAKCSFPGRRPVENAFFETTLLLSNRLINQLVRDQKKSSKNCK